MATVMKVRGSAYRRPGARMLMAAGRTAGMISGGCLENDARERGRAVMESGVPQLVTYDSTAPDDIVFGLGLGCNGIVQVLIEPLTAGDDTGLLAFLAACVARRQVGRVATVFQSDDFPLGARLLRWRDGSVTTNFDDPALSAALMKTLQEYAARRAAVRGLELSDGRSAGGLIEAVARKWMSPRRQLRPLRVTECRIMLATISLVMAGSDSVGGSANVVRFYVDLGIG